jgi:tetratricopeptide (TPR) repeat protein
MFARNFHACLVVTAFVLISTIHLDLGVIRSNYMLLEPLSLCIISITSLIFLPSSLSRISISRLEASFLLFLLYYIVRCSMMNPFPFQCFMRLSTFVLFYFSLKLHTLGGQAALFFNTVRNGFLGVMLLVLFVAALDGSIFNKEVANLFVPNQSILGIFLAAMLVFVITSIVIRPYHLKMIGINKAIIGLILAGTLYILILTNGRSGWMGVCVGGAFVFLHFIKVRFGVLLWAFLAIVILSGILLLYKLDSSRGRILIYKVSANALEGNWLFGIGPGRVSSMYNQYQAQYFSNQSIDDPEALLAGNTQYLFNDFFEIFIELGITGILLLTAFLYQLICLKKRIYLKRPAAYYRRLPMDASMISLSTGSLFSYPIHIDPIALMMVIYLATNYDLAPEKIYIPNPSPGFALHLIFLLSCFIMFAFHYQHFRFRQLCAEALELSDSGYRKQSLALYQYIQDNFPKNGQVAYQHAIELFHFNDLKEARKMIMVSKKLSPSHEIYILSARIEQELGNNAGAEKDFQIAVYMVPNRMRSRRALMDHYVQAGDTAKAIHWGHSILNMRVKVPSAITSHTLKSTKALMDQLQRKE